MIITIIKPFGITSIKFLKEFQEKNGISKATCVGKLDPLAKGQLVILTDDDTKKMKEYMTSSKKYEFTLILGIETESHDCLSTVKNIKDNIYTEKDIHDKLESFIKNYTLQTMPLVSSYTVKHNGIKNPLWWFYKEGYRDITLPEKKVEIYNWSIKDTFIYDLNTLIYNFMNRIKKISDPVLVNSLNVKEQIEQWKMINNTYSNTKHIIITMEMTVSSGFYIRRFCHDFGKYIESHGLAFDIIRTEIIPLKN